MPELFTRVEIVFYPEFVNHWLRFGMPDASHDLDRRRSLALFRSGKVFGYVRWRANEYGTREWSFTIVRTSPPTTPLTRLQGVYPGGEVLLAAMGSAKVKRALAQIDQLEVEGFQPCAISPAHYRHLHNRMTIGRPVRTYSQAQHTAHLAALAASR